MVQVDKKALAVAVTPGTRLMEAQLSARALSVTVAGGGGWRDQPSRKMFPAGNDTHPFCSHFIDESKPDGDV